MRDAFGRVQSVVVLGGGSEIATATLLELLRDGPLDVVLAARRPEELDSSPLEEAGARVERIAFDAKALDEHPALVDGLFDGRRDVDLLLVAFGTLPSQEEAERNQTLAVETAMTNFVGAVSVLTLAHERLCRQGHGTIVVLSSVAAQRARRSNYVYGASKAGLDAFADGLQLASAGTGVGVLVVRPGFVRTKMTEGLRPAPLSTDAATVGRAIAAAVRDGVEGPIWAPPALRYAMWLVRALPRRVLRAL